MKKSIFEVILILAALTLALTACFLIPSESESPTDIETPSVTRYTLNFNLADYYAGATPQSQSIEEGQAGIQPAGPTRLGYDFLGWYPDAQYAGEAWDFDTVLTANTTLYAKWSLSEYNVSFDLAGGSGVTPGTQSVNYLEKIICPDMNTSSTGIQNPEKAGYTFAGWWLGSAVDAYTQEWNFDSDLPDSDMTLYAGWGTLRNDGDYEYIELANAVKITDYVEEDITENTLTIPSVLSGKNVLSIGEDAFEYLTGPSNIVLPANLTTICSEAFRSSSAPTSITIPNTVTSIGKLAFWSCFELYNVNLGTGVRNIGEMAFYQCTALADYSTATLVIPANVISIEKNAFNISTIGGAIFNLTLNEGLIYIGEEAFCHAYILRLDLPDTVEFVGKKAFCYCTYLTRIEFGKGILTIGEDAFNSCNNSLYIIMNTSRVPELGSVAVFGTYTVHNEVANRANFYICVPSGSVEAYRADENWGYYYDSQITVYDFTELIMYPTR